jgi:ribosomal 50S subunit-recycling heat shock protein
MAMIHVLRSIAICYHDLEHGHVSILRTAIAMSSTVDQDQEVSIGHTQDRFVLCCLSIGNSHERIKTAYVMIE